MKRNLVVNIVIFFLSIIDAVLIYYVDVQTESVMAEIIWDVGGTVLFYVGWHFILEDNENAIHVFKWGLFIALFLGLVGIIFTLKTNQLLSIQTNFSILIPLSLTYFIFLIKNKLEEKYII